MSAHSLPSSNSSWLRLRVILVALIVLFAAASPSFAQPAETTLAQGRLCVERAVVTNALTRPLTSVERRLIS